MVTIEMDNGQKIEIEQLKRRIEELERMQATMKAK